MKEYEEIFRSTFEQVAIGMAHVNLDGKFIRINQRLCDILKYSREELLSFTIQDITYLDDRNDIIKARDSVLTGETSAYITEKRYIRKDGSLVWANLTLSIAYNSEGKYQYFISVIEDITEKRENEQRLKESDENYQVMINNLDIGFYRGELNGKLLFHNKKLNEILGYDSSESLVGSLAIKFADDEETLKQYHEELIKKGFVKNFILPIQDPKSNKKYVKLSSHLIKGKNGTPIAVEGTVIDITEKYVLEQKLKQSEKRYRALLEDMLEGYYTVDFKGNFTYINDYFCKTLEYSKEEVLGKNYQFIYEEKTSKRLFKLFKQVYESETPLFHTSRPKTSANEEKRVFLEGLITRRGKLVFHEGIIDLLYDSEGNKIGFYGFIRDITDKVTAEQNLKDSEKKYREILENMIEGYLETDLKGNYIFVNDYFCKIVGYTREELLGKNFRLIYNEKRSNDVYRLYNQLYKNEISPPLIYEDQLLSSSGETTYIEGLADLKYDSEGNKIGFYGFIRNTTERKRSEQNLKESENKYREILENIKEGYFEVDLKGNYTFVNDYLCKMLGYSQEEILGRSYNFVYSDKRAKDVYALYNQLFKNEISPPLVFENQLLTQSGKIVYYEALADLKYDAEGNRVGFFGLLRDITERKITEQKLKESEKKYREILENIKEGFFEVDLKGNYTFVNDYLSKMLGYSKEELLGMSYELVFDDRKSKEVSKLYNQLFKNEISPPLVFEDQLLTQSGEIIYYEAVADLKYDSEGKKVGFFGLARDITERKIAEQKLIESEEKYRNIIENAKEGYYEVDLKGNFTFFNTALCELLKYSPEEALGLHYKSFMDEENSKKILKAFNEVYRTGIEQPHFQYKIVTKNGEHLFGETSVSLKYDSEREKIGFSGFLRDITEKKISEQKLQESEKKYREILENIKEGYFEVDLRGDLTFVNDYYCKLLGHSSKEEILGMGYRNFQSEKTSDKLFKIYNQLYNNEIPSPVMFERDQLTSSGETIYYEVLTDLKYDSEGNKVGFFGLLRDITARTEAEEKLKESEEKFSGILLNIKEGYFEGDLKGNYTYVNDYLCKLLGYTREELLGKNYHMTHDVSSSKEVFKLFNQLYKNEISPPLIYERQVLTQSGERPFIEGLVDLKYDSEGNKIGFFGLIRDITERKIVEKRLKESEEKFRLLTEQSLMGIAILQGDQYKYVNREFANTLGYPIGEILNWKPGAYIEIIYPKDRQFVREQATKKQDGKTNIRKRYEFRITKKTGEIVWVEIFSGTIIYEEKKADLITISNISERKKVEAVLKEQKKELKEINELKSEFLRRASHELKTPLISIKGFTNLLLQLHRDDFNPEVISMLLEVDRGCQRLEDIIHNILETTKLESSSLQLYTSMENLSFLIRFCIKELHFLIKSRNHTLLVNINDKIITKFNKEQIYEVINNFLINSIKYTIQENGVLLR